MSGVLALVSLDGRMLPRELAQAQVDAIRHRGDGEPALWFGEGVALGQAFRPTTPEAEREILPLVDVSGRFHLVWDGRIDNRDELARAFGWKGERAREATDADHVLEAYVRWGDACVTRLLGDWAIVIWDSVARRLFAAKDPMGFRSLFWAEHDGLFAIGSEPLQVLQPSWLPPRPDYDSMRRYLVQALPRRESTYYVGLFDLWGGQTLSVEGGRCAVTTFWSAPRVAQIAASEPEEYVEIFESLVRASVRQRTRSRKPVGVFFSGGLDSSYVLAVASEFAPVVAISSYVSGTNWDERAYQKSVVEHLGVEWRTVDVRAHVPLSAYQPQNEFDIASTPPQGPMWHAQAEAAVAAGVDITMGGEGGDEWMSGRRAPSASALLAGHWRSAYRLAKSASPHSPARLILRESYSALASPRVRRAIRNLRYGALASAPFFPMVTPSPDWRPAEYPPVWNRQGTADFIWSAIHVLKEHVAWRERWVLSRRGLESRMPFYSLPVIEFLASVPDWVTANDGRPKYLLRTAEARLLPPDIPTREDKATWDEPLVEGLRKHATEALASIGALAEDPDVDIEVARRELVRVLDHQSPYTVLAWLPVAAGNWLRQLRVLQLGCSDQAGSFDTLEERRANAKIV